MEFADRHDAGRRLAAALQPFAAEHPLVVALPRGGVPVAAEVARVLQAPLDILAVRKLGAPGNPEFGIGAIAEDGGNVLDAGSARRLGMTQELLDATVEQERRELRRRIGRYRGGRPPVAVAGRTVILVDDGLATGLTTLAAVRTLRERNAQRIVVAVPVGAPESVALVAQSVDEVVCLHSPPDFGGVGRWYRDFSPVPDAEVVALLEAAEPERHRTVAVRGGPAAEDVSLAGELTIPAGARGLVIFAHGSGSSRHSPRNRAVARTLQQAGFATLLLDLLSEQEEGRRDLVFDIPLLARRLELAIRWARAEPDTQPLPIGLFGASTGAAAALQAAAAEGDGVRAVVSRGGRPDLAADHLPQVTAPTLLLVGGADTQVLALNRQAAARLRCPHELTVVAGATHLFEEPGTLAAVAGHAADWFAAHLPAGSRERAATEA